MLTTTYQLLNIYYLRITAPHARVTDPLEQLYSRLFAFLFTFIAVLMAIQSVIFIFAYSGSERDVRVLGCTATCLICVICYRLARRGNYRLGILIVIVLGSAIVFLMPILIEGHNSLHTLYYLGIITTFAVIFLKLQTALTIFIVFIAGLFTLPLLRPHLTIVEVTLEPGSFLIVLTLSSFLFREINKQINQVYRQEIEASEHRYKIVSELMSDYAFCSTVDENGVMSLEWVTDSFERVTGYPPQELIHFPNQPILFHPADQELIPKDMALVLQGQTIIREYRIITKTGQERWIQMYRRPEWDEQHQRIIRYYGVTKDITDQKQAVEQNLKFTLQEEQLNLINNLMNAISHDFRTSLTAIESSRYLMERKLPDEARLPIQPKLNSIQNHVVRLTEQLDHLAEISFLTNPNPRPCDLNAVVRHVLREHTQISKAKKQELIFLPDEDISNGLVDENAITNVVTHLITNAANFTPVEGKITITTQYNGKEILLKIQDTGMGIKPENQAHIFELFFREDPGRGTYTGGVGIGLSIVKMVAEAHGGSISVESTPGEGSTFTLALPAVP